MNALCSPLLFTLSLVVCCFVTACGGDDPIGLADDGDSMVEMTADEAGTEARETDSGSDADDASGADGASGADDTSMDPDEADGDTSAADDGSLADDGSGSGDPGEDGASPDGAPAAGSDCNLGGNWSGVFYNEVSGEREAINATVSRTGLDVVIRTSKAFPPGQFFTGTVNGQCGLLLIDAFDGEDWTTKFGGADANQLRIADFQVELRDPITGLDPLNVIELVR